MANFERRYVPQVSKIIAQGCAEVVFHNAGRRVILERKSFLPWKLGGESSGEATGITTVFTEFPQCPLLLMKGSLEEMVRVAMCLGDEIRIDAVVHH